MKNPAIRLVSLLGIISIIGIVFLQIFWFRKAFDIREKQFDQNASIALTSVGEAILTMNHQQLPSSGLVNQISSNYYTVSVNGEISAEVLETLLKAEFRSRGLMNDFEYAVYDCNSQKLVYGKYISLAEGKSDEKPGAHLPEWKNDLYYFGVNFPNKRTEITGSMDIWFFSSSVLLVVVVFFAFSLIALFRQKQLSEIQKDFVNNMTHEFKTPISTILVSTKLLGKTEGNDASASTQYVNLITQEASRLKNQVERILQVAVWDEKKLKYKFEPIDLHACITNAMDSLELTLKEKNGTIEKRLNAASSMLQGDALHLTNTAFNLIDNAIKYSGERPQIVVETKNENGRIIFSVQDKGVGISRRYIRRIFDRFYRVPTGNIHDVKGFGLGLHYVKTIIKAHQGTITVNSKEGEGTTFTIILPLRT